MPSNGGVPSKDLSLLPPWEALTLGIRSIWLLPPCDLHMFRLHNRALPPSLSLILGLIKTSEMFSSEFGGTCREHNNLQATLKNEMPIGMGILFFKNSLHCCCFSCDTRKVPKWYPLGIMGILIKKIVNFFLHCVKPLGASFTRFGLVKGLPCLLTWSHKIWTRYISIYHFSSQ